MRRRLRDRFQDQGTRIDARPPSEAKAAGVRSIHRDTDGTEIGGIAADGTPMGSRRRRGPADGSSLGNPSTPGLDRRAAWNDETADATQGSRLLADRQALHREMMAVGRDGVTPEMRERARALGVTNSSWSRVAAGLPASGGSGRVMARSEQVLTPVPAPSSSPSPSVQPSPAAAKGSSPSPERFTHDPVPTLPDGTRINRLTGKPIEIGYKSGPAPRSPGKLAQKFQGVPSGLPDQARPQKTGGLEDVIADVAEARRSTGALVNPMPNFDVKHPGNVQAIGGNPDPVTAQQSGKRRSTFRDLTQGLAPEQQALVRPPQSVPDAVPRAMPAATAASPVAPVTAPQRGLVTGAREAFNAELGGNFQRPSPGAAQFRGTPASAVVQGAAGAAKSHWRNLVQAPGQIAGAAGGAFNAETKTSFPRSSPGAANFRGSPASGAVHAVGAGVIEYGKRWKNAFR